MTVTYIKDLGKRQNVKKQMMGGIVVDIHGVLQPMSLYPANVKDNDKNYIIVYIYFNSFLKGKLAPKITAIQKACLYV